MQAYFLVLTLMYSSLVLTQLILKYTEPLCPGGGRKSR